MLRSATLSDLTEVASWIDTARDCELWAGWRVPFPIDLEALTDAISFGETNAFALVEEKRLLGFGQARHEGSGRGHLARVIVNPISRGKGYGEALPRKGAQ